MSSGVAVDFSALSKAGTSLAAGLEESRKQTLLQALGGQVQSGDYAGAAKTAFDAGDLQTGLSLVKLGDDKAGTANFQAMLGQAGGIGGILGASTGTPAPVQPVAPVAPKISGNAETKAGAIVSGLIKRGIDPKVASAAAGNFLIESSFDNTNGTGDNGTAFGLGQWRNERFDALKRTAGQRGWQDIEAQLDHTAAELKGSHKGAYDAALAAPDASSAALAFMNKFEIPSRAAAAESGPRRAAAAARFHAQFGGGSTPPPAAVAGMNPSPQRVQVASADPGFVPQDPSLTAGAAPAPTMAIPDDPVPAEQRVQVAQAAPQVFQQAGLNPQAAAQLQATQPGSRARVETIIKFMSHPKAPEGFKDAMKAALANEFAIDKENRSMTADQKEYAWRVANGYRGSPEEMLTEKRKGADPVDIQKYEYAKKNNGYAGTLVDFLKTEAEAKSTRVTTNVTPGETEARKVLGKDEAEKHIAVYDEASKAQSTLDNVRVLKEAMASPNFYSGTMGGLATQAKQALASFGISAADSAVPNEAFIKVSTKALIDQVGSLSSGFSNGDRQFAEKAGNNIDVSQAGNQLIAEMLERTAQRKLQVAKMADDYLANKPDGSVLDRKFHMMVRRFGEANPVFKGLENMPGVADKPTGRGSSPPAGQRDASVQAPPPPAVGTKSKGFTFVGGNPADPAAWRKD